VHQTRNEARAMEAAAEERVAGALALNLELVKQARSLWCLYGSKDVDSGVPPYPK